MVAPPRNPDSSLRRAAILLSNLDAESRRRLLAHLPPRDAATLRAAAASLADVDPLEVRRTVTAFVGRVTIARQELATAASEQTAGAATAVDDSADTPASEPAAPKGALQFLHDVPDATLLRAVQSQHPQTIAVVLASIAPKQAARLLKQLEPHQRSEAIRRLGRLEDVPQEAIDDIGRHLRDLIGAIGELGGGEGRRKLASIFSELGADDHTWLDPKLATSDGVIAAAWADAERSFSSRPTPVGSASSAEPPTEAAKSRNEEVDAPRILPIDSRSSARAGGAVDAVRGNGRTAEPHRQLEAASHDSRPGGESPAGESPAGESGHRPSEESEAAVPAISAEHATAVLEQLRPAQLREVLAELPTRQSLLAVCGLSPRCVRRLLRAMPRRQAKEVRQRVDALGPLELREVDRAKCAAAAVVLRGAAPFLRGVAPASEAPRRTRAA